MAIDLIHNNISINMTSKKSITNKVARIIKEKGIFNKQKNNKK